MILVSHFKFRIRSNLYNRMRVGPSSNLLENTSEEKVLLDMLIIYFRLLLFCFEFDVL